MAMSWSPSTARCIQPAILVFLVVLTTFSVIIISLFHNICGVRNKAEHFDSLVSPRALKKQILLVTNGRSGSSFTSALISHHEDVFFFFEPLHGLNASVSRNYNEKDSMAIIQEFFTCNFTAQHSFVLDSQHFASSESTMDFYSCMKASVNGTSHISCFLQMLDKCRRKQFTFIKTIRFQVRWTESLLTENPQFKLLFLVRDPRATLFSQARVFKNFNQSTQLYNISHQYCSSLALDLQDAERLHKLYPGQVKGIRYEHGATDPLSYAKDIYNFLGLSFDDALVDYIQNITTAPIDAPNVNHDYGVIRHNSTQTMNKWRFNATFSSVREIDTSCGHLYSKLGYQPIVSDTHLESEKSLVLSPERDGIF